MKKIGVRCWLLVCFITAAGLQACGGGGDSDSSIVTSASGAKMEAPFAAKTSRTEQDALLPIDIKVGEDFAQRPPTQSPFARENTYRVFAANGSEKVLRLDFAGQRYEMIDSTGQSTAGSFSADANEPGTYVFASDRITSPINTARFRVADGAVVGTFPFEKTWSSPIRYVVAPFVAANKLVTTPAELDGDYNRFGVNQRNDGTQDSQILALRIQDGGRTLLMCWDNIIYRIERCPSASRRVYALTSGEGSSWVGINTSTSSDVISFSMARVNGENVILFAGPSVADPTIRALRIGLQATAAWTPATYVGGSTLATWDSNRIDGANAVLASIGPDGPIDNLTLPVSPPISASPTGLYALNTQSPSRYYAMKNSALAVVVGMRNPETEGYIEIGLLRESMGSSDPRNGPYKLFSTNGQTYDLTIDFDQNTYSLSSSEGYQASGVIRRTPQGEYSSGTYEFVSAPSTTGFNVARFVVTQDALVGALPVPLPLSTTAQPRPFVAARSFITDRSELATVTNLYATWLVTSSDGTAVQGPPLGLAFGPSGDTLSMCFYYSLYLPGMPPESCSVGTASTNSIVPGSSPGSWRIDTGLVADPLNFYVARIGLDRVFLAAKSGQFHIGLDTSLLAPAWRSLTARGALYKTDGPTSPGSTGFESIDCTTTACSATAITAQQNYTQSFPLTVGPPGAPVVPIRYSPSPATNPAGTYVIHQGRNVLLKYLSQPTGQNIFIGIIPGAEP